MDSGFEGPGLLPGLPTDGETASRAEELAPDEAELAQQEPQAPEAPLAAQDAAPLTGEPAGHMAAALATMAENLEKLAASAEHYHARAEQRETVISHLHSEVDRLRQGERRSLLRPLLVEVCRLRDDLLRQAEDLPDDFDADRARLLLRSYADSIELALEDNGVATFAPEKCDRFEPRLHRRVGGEAADDPELAGRVARVRRGGYLDLDTNTPVAPAEVLLFTAVSVEPPQSPSPLDDRSDRGEGSPGRHESADATDERNLP